MVSGLGALLGACGLHSCLELGEIAANGIYTLEHDHPAVYSVLSKIYGDKGVCSDITGLDKLMKKWRATKQKASRMCVCYEASGFLRNTFIKKLLKIYRSSKFFLFSN